MIEARWLRGWIAALILFAPSVMSAAPFTSSTSGDWSQASTWGGVGVPGVGDDVTITSNHVVTVSDPRIALSVTLDSTPGNKMLVIQSGGSLLVELAGGTAITISAPSPGSTNIIRLDGGTLTASNLGTNLSITGGASSAAKLEFTSLGGTASFADNVVFAGTAANAQIDFGTSSGTVELGGDLGSGGTIINSSSSTFIFNGTGSQTINGYTFSNVIVDKAGGTATLNGPISVQGNLDIQNGVLDDGGHQISLNVALTSAVTVRPAGVLKLGSATSATQFPLPVNPANVTLQTSSAVAYHSALPQTINSSIIYSRLFLQTVGGSVTHGFSGTLQVSDQLDVSDNGLNEVTLDVAGNSLDVDADITGNGTISATTGSINIGGSWSATSQLIAGSSTVTYDGGVAQFVLGAAYHSLVISKSANTATLSGSASASSGLLISSGTLDLAANTLTVSGVTNTGTLNLNTGTLSISGDMNSGGAILGATGKVQLDGSTPQNWSSDSVTIQILEMNNTAGATMGSDIVVTGNMKLSSGNITIAGSFAIDVLATVTHTSGWFVGPLTMGMNPSPARRFHVGTNESYLAVDADAGSAGLLTIAALEGKHPSRTGDNVLERYWSIVSPSSVVPIDSITFNYNNSDVTTGTESRYHLAQFDDFVGVARAPIRNSGSWTQHGDVVDENANAATVTNVSAYETDWIIGQRGSVGAAGKVSITSINGGTNPSAGVPFDVNVQSQFDNLTPANVDANTTITLSLDTGTGTLSGTLSGTINGGTNSATISGVEYDTVEAGLVMRATASGGDPLEDGTLAFQVQAPPSILTVSNLNDTGAGSLRDAIDAHNTGGCTLPCMIQFGVSGTISLSSPLPAIVVDQLTIDGFTAPGAMPNMNAFGLPSNAVITVAIDGASGVNVGLDIQEANVDIRGLAIKNFLAGGTGIGVRFTGDNSGSNVSGCYIGLDLDGVTPAGNGKGVVMDSSLESSLGGALPADRNVIGSSTTDGVSITGTSNTVSLLGNYVGVAANLSASRPNQNGISVCNGCTGISIGNSGVGNVVSGNVGVGIELNGNGAALEANIVGPAGSASTAFPNNVGIRVSSGASNNTIGGISPSATNVVSGNTTHGIEMLGTSTTVDQNRIGVAPDGTTALGNGGSGVRLSGGASNNIVGASFGNEIANNVQPGVNLDATAGVGNVIRQNKLRANGGLSIDLGNDGSTANDATDADIGPNNFQNFPTISSASIDAGFVNVAISLNSSGGVSANFFNFDIYRSDASTPSPALEYLGGSGCIGGSVFNNFSFGVPQGTATVGGRIVVTATAYSDAACTTASEGTSELSATAVLAGDIHWINPLGGSWETPGNWNPAVVPTAADDVFIDAAGTYTVTVNSPAQANQLHVGTGVSGTQTLQITTGNSLVFNAASDVAVTGVLALDGNSFGGNAAMSINGAVNWSSGQITGTATLDIAAGATININGGATKTLVQRTLNIGNGGTANWNGGNLALSAAHIVNFGLFEIKTDASLNDVGGDLGFDNLGTLRKSTTTGTTLFSNVDLDHSAGTIDVQTGTIDLATASITAAVSISSGAKLLVNSDVATFGAGATVSNTGLLHVTGGTLTVDTGVLTVPRLTMDGGTLDGVGTVATGAGGIFTWNGGSMSGAGQTSVDGGGQMIIGLNTSRTLARSLAVLPAGSVTWNDNATIQLSSGGSITNDGTFDATGNGTLSNGGGGGSILNGGTFRKSISVGGTTIVNNLTFTNNGTLDIQVGKFDPGTFNSSGTIQLASLTELLINSDTATLTGGTVTGAGKIRVIGGSLSVDGNINIPGLELDSPGTVQGLGLLTYNTFLWNGGTMQGTGTTRGTSGTSLTLATPTSKTLGRLLDIQSGGNVGINGVGSLTLGPNGSITNAGTVSAQVDFTILNGGGGGLTNNNLFVKSAGAGPIVFDVPLTNNGTVDVQSGLLDLAGGTNNATFQTLSATEVLINSDSYTFAAGASFSGAGILHVSAGTLNVTGNVAVTNYTQDNGTLDGAGTMTITGTGAWGGGIMQGGGTTNVGGTATLTMSGLLPKLLINRTLGVLNGATVNLSGAGNVALQNGGNIANAGNFNITADQTFSNSGAAGGFANSGTLTKSATTGATTFDNINLANNGGTIDIQLGSIAVTNSGGYSQSGGFLKFLLGGVTPGTQHGQLVLSGSQPSFNGTLEVALNGPYQPIGGDSFRIISITGGAHTGDFTQPYTLPALSPGRTWNDAYDSNGLLLSVAGQADLSIAKSAPSNNVLVGAPVTYTLTVTNHSVDAASGVSVSDTLPAGHTGISASGTGWTCNVIGDNVQCTANGPLPNGAAPSITINANAPSTPQTFINFASVSSDTDPDNSNDSANWTITVQANAADIELSSVSPSAPIAPLTPFQFDFSVKNNGPQTATGVVFTAPIPPELTFGTATSDQGTCNFAASTVTCNLGSVANGATVHVLLDLTSTTAAGTHFVVGSGAATEADPVPNNSVLTPIQVSGSVVTVVNTNDSGAGSLRQALLDAESGVCTTPCTIDFNIPAAPFTIQPLSDLPDIDSDITVDATTQPGYVNAPIIEVDSSLNLGAPTVFRLTGTGSQIKGLAITKSPGKAIEISGNNNTVEASYIGLTPLGAAAANDSGIFLSGDGNTIGGAAAAARNVISGNTTYGIRVMGIDAVTLADSNSITNNWIGPNGSGTAALPNGSGIVVDDFTDGTVISDNTISGNQDGLVLNGPLNTDATVTTNLIGVAPDGTTPMGNAQGTIVISGAIRSQIGGTSGSDGNTIAHGGQNGIAVVTGSSNSFLGNSTHDNALLGIDLGSNGPTPNDSVDADGGANGVQNFPTLTSATLDGVGGMTINYNIDSSAATAASILTEFFEADAAGEGKTFITRVCTPASAFGAGASFAAPGFITAGDLVVATATSYTDGACTTIGDGTSEFSTSVVVTLCTPPPAVLNTPPSVCTGATSVVANVNAPTATSFDWTVTNGTLLSGDGTNGIVFNPGASGNVVVSVTVTDAVGCVNTVTNTIPIHPLPVVAITGPTATCDGVPVTLDAGPGFANYNWSNGALTQAITVTPTSPLQTFSVIVTDVNGCSASDSHTVTVSANPTAAITAPPSVCENSTGNSASVPVQGGATYAWSITNGVLTSTNNGPTVTFTAGASGNVQLDVTITVGSCTSNGSVNVPIAAAPTVSIIAQAAVCANATNLAAAANAPGATSFNWGITNGTIVSGQGTSNITFNPTGPGSTTLTLSVTNAAGCSASTSQNVAVNAPTVVNISGPTATCNGTPVTLDAGSGFASYSWSNGASSQTITVTPTAPSETFTVTVTDGNSCAATDSHTVSVSNNPTATITAPPAVCASSTGNTATVPTQAGATYAWSIANGSFTSATNGPTVTFNAGATGNVDLSVTITVGACTSNGSISIPTSAAPVVTITGPTQSCPGSSFTLSAGAGFSTYQWSNGAQTPTITVSQSATTATYSVIVTDNAGCAVTDTHVVTLFSAASVAISAPDTAVANATGLVASVPDDLAASYHWTISNGAITSATDESSITFNVGASGQATIIVQATKNGCTTTSNHTVFITADADDEADLAVTKSAPPSVASGGTFVYTIGATNLGPDPAGDVVVIDSLPVETTLVEIGEGTFDCFVNANRVTCNGALGIGQSNSITITVAAPAESGTITNHVTIFATISDPDDSNNAASATTEVLGGPSACATVPPALLTPADQASVSGTVLFSWSAVNGATLYELWLIHNNLTSLATTTTTTSAMLNVPSGTSSWFVVARLPGGCDPLLSPQRTFRVAEGPNCATHGAPQITSPFDNATAGTPLLISWTPVPQAIGYRVWIEADGTAPQDIGTTNGAISLIAAVPSGSIVIYVDALFAACPETRSPSIHITIPRPDPCANRAAAAPISPANNAIVNSSSIDFLWSPAAGADSYRVWFSLDGGEPAVLGTTTETSLHAAIGRGVLLWWLEALFPGCASTESARFRFTIPQQANCSTDRPTLLTPQAAVTVSNGDVTFSWTAVPGAVNYEVWLAEEKGLPILLGMTNGTSLRRIVSPGTFVWFVRAIVDRCPARNSQTARFTHQPPPNCLDLDRPIAISPMEGAAIEGAAAFEWSKPNGATSFELFTIRGNAAPQLVTSTPSSSVDDIALAPGKLHWFIRAHFNGCSPLDSEERELEIAAPSPSCDPLDAPTVTAPGQISSGVPFLVQWSSSLGATSYQLQIASTPSFDGAETITTNATKHELLRTNNGSAPLGVFARVRAIDGSCQPVANISAYGSSVAIFILPRQGTDASLPLTGGVVTFIIPIGPELAGQSFTATTKEPWLTVSPASGVVGPTGTSLLVTANGVGLPPGTSLGALTITLNTPASGNVKSLGTTVTIPTMSVSLVSPVAPAPKSSPPPDALIIPAVAHADGINSKFQSDVRVSNASPQLIKYQLTFTPSGDAGMATGKQTTFSVEPGHTVALDDVLKSWFGTGGGSAIGTLEIRPLTLTSNATSSVAMTGLANLVSFASSRTFNVTSNGTFGQYIPAIPFANFVGRSLDLSKPTALSLQQIAHSDRYRTNLGIVEGSGQTASILISVFGSDGQKLAEFTKNLAGGEHTQLNGFATQNGISSLTDGRVEIQVLSSTGKVTAYASVLDNQTNDPLLVTPVTLTGGGNSKWVVPGVADLNNGFANWQTDMRVFNAGTEAVDATFAFYSQGGGAPKIANVTVPAGRVVQFDKALASLFGVTNDGGAVHITTPAAARLITTARTYNQTTGGTYGQFISAVTPSEAAGVESRALQILQVEESNRFRSNIGLFEVTGNPVKIEVSVVPPDAKFTAVTELTLQPNEFRQIGSLLKSVGLDQTFNARVTVRAIEGSGRVAAYASVIDALTNDPTYVPSQ